MIAALLREKAEKRPVFFVLNKMDSAAHAPGQAEHRKLLGLAAQLCRFHPVSALNGTNLPLLREKSHPHPPIPEGPRLLSRRQITDQTEHQIAGELNREACCATPIRKSPTPWPCW
jgi:GTPase Era involved in 16S rRNA processing